MIYPLYFQFQSNINTGLLFGGQASSEAISQVTLDFACKSCHRDGGSATVKTDEELKAEAIGYHER